ncbi:hypothetical protein J6590_002408 [Homalodisca vitripennis]|nr:hypothetical protein J6590_002408 [Homalodisca vitripennis]
MDKKPITGLVYLDMLELFVFPQLDDIEQQTGQRIIFMQDGAPPHYHREIRDLDHLLERISSAILTVTPDMIGRTWQEVDYRLDICRATNGAHIETY